MRILSWAVLGVLLVAGLVYGIWDDWPSTMGDPRQCDAEDRTSLNEALEGYAKSLGDPDDMRQTNRELDYFVREGCISPHDLEERKAEIVRAEQCLDQISWASTHKEQSNIFLWAWHALFDTRINETPPTAEDRQRCYSGG